MRKMITKVIFFKEIATWSVIFLCCVVALGKFFLLLRDDLVAGKDFFLPGVAALGIAIAAVLFFSLTRIRHYVQLFRKT